MQKRRTAVWTVTWLMGLMMVSSGTHSAAPAGPARIRSDSPEERREHRSVNRNEVRSYGKQAFRPATSEMRDSGAVDSQAQEAVASDSGVGPIRKISGVPMAGSVTAFVLSPDGATAVYIADQDTQGRFELFSSPVDGSATPTKISNGLALDGPDVGVSTFQITPDSSRVVFLADANHGSGTDDIFSVPIDGSAAPVLLNSGSEAPVTAFGLTASGSWVVFFGVDSQFGSGGVEAYAASIGVTASATQISDAGFGNPAGNVIFADLSPDSTTVIYAADAVSDEVFQWFSVPISATAPGSDVQLSAALGSVDDSVISPDSATVAYLGDDNTLGVMDVFTVAIGGGAPVRLNPPMAGAGATAVEFSPGGDRVAYLADQDTSGVIEVYSALSGVAASGTRLNTPMAGTQLVDTLNISPDGTTVLYEADANSAGTFELFGAPIDASAGPSTLHGLTPPNSAGFFEGSGTPILGRRAVYPVFGATVDLFSVPFDGSEPFTQINDPLAQGDALFNAFLPGSATRLMAFGVGPAAGAVTEEVFAAPIRSDLPPEQINVSAAPGALGVLGYEITASESYGVYLQDQDTAGKPELFSRELDSDADTVVNVADNCPFIDNPSQGSVGFGQTVYATSKTRFAWDAPADVRFARGRLAAVSAYVFAVSGVLPDTSSYSDDTSPATAAGLYFLFATDCTGRSYQTAPGAEPGRDLASLP